MKRLVVCVGLASCGGDGGGRGSIDLDQLGMELAVVSCAKQFDCCTDAEIMEQYMGISHDGEPIDSEEKCVELANAILSGLAIAQFQESLAKGRIEYDGTAAAACVAAVEDVSCSQYKSQVLDSDGGCREFVHAKVPDGGACLQDYECTSNNCVGEDTPLGEPHTDGACMPMPADGESCDRLDDNCEGDLICDADVGTSDYSCRPARTDGTQCVVDSHCASDYCDDDGMCAQEPVTCDGR